EERGIVRGRVELALVDAPEHGLRIVAGRIPKRGVQPREERSRGTVPAEPQVVGELLQAGELGGQARGDFERKSGPWTGHGFSSVLGGPKARRRGKHPEVSGSYKMVRKTKTYQGSMGAQPHHHVLTARDLEP